MQRTSMDPFWAGLIYEHLWSFIFDKGANYTQPAECETFNCENSENNFGEEKLEFEQLELSQEDEVQTGNTSRSSFKGNLSQSNLTDAKVSRHAH